MRKGGTEVRRERTLGKNEEKLKKVSGEEGIMNGEMRMERRKGTRGIWNEERERKKTNED